jgi:hypothetical protein
VLTDSLDQLDLLDQGRHDLLVAKPVCHVPRGLLGGAPSRHVRWQEVMNSAGGFDRLAHRVFDCKKRRLAD